VKGPHLAVGAVLALLVSLLAFKAPARMADFEVYWLAGARAAAGEPLYRDEDEHYQLKYLPAFAILAIPAALIPLTAAKVLWCLWSVALAGALLGLSLAVLPSREKPAWAIFTLSVIAMAKFYGHEMVLGQVNLLLATVILAAVHLIRRGHAVAAGLLVALGVVIKPYAMIFLPWFAARGPMRAIVASGAGVGGALALPVAVYGVHGTVSLHQAWWHTVTESTGPNLLNPDNVSLAAMYAKWIGAGAAATRLAVLTGAVLLGAVAVCVAMRRRVSAPDGLEAALLLTLIPLLSPQGWDYVFLLSTPAVVYLVNYESHLPLPLRIATIGALAAIAFSLYDVMGRQAYAVFMGLSVISVCYLVLTVALLTLRVRRIA
jgi:hypothetical protein